METWKNSSRLKLTPRTRSSLKSTRGTGHLVPDLVECSVLVENNKSKLTTRNLKRPPQNYLSSSSNKTVKCSLCQNQGEEMTPFSRNSKETIIFYKQILQQEQRAMPASRYLTWFCLGCAGTLGKLVKLKEKIETITTVLRNVVRIQQKGQNGQQRLRQRSNITYFDDEDGDDNNFVQNEEKHQIHANYSDEEMQEPEEQDGSFMMSFDDIEIHPDQEYDHDIDYDDDEFEKKYQPPSPQELDEKFMKFETEEPVVPPVKRVKKENKKKKKKSRPKSKPKSIQKPKSLPSLSFSIKSLKVEGEEYEKIPRIKRQSSIRAEKLILKVKGEQEEGNNSDKDDDDKDNDDSDGDKYVEEIEDDDDANDVKDLGPPQTCTECDTVFENKRHLQRHNRDVHNLYLVRHYSHTKFTPNADGVFKCEICNLEVDTGKKFDQHLRTWIHYVATNCKITRINNNDQEQTNNQNPEIISCFSCDSCLPTGNEEDDLYFATLDELLGHKYECHSEQVDKFICKPCEKEIINGIGYRNHLFSKQHIKKAGLPSSSLSLEPPIIYKCPDCPREYYSERTFDKHKKIHSLIHICDKCGKAYHRPGLLRDHILTHEGEDDNAILIVPAQPPPEKPFVCLAPQCERRFAKKSHLKGHIHSWHKELLHPCNLCSESFVAHRQLKRHRIKIHGQDQIVQVQYLLPGGQGQGQGQPVILPAATERLLCTYCEKTYKNKLLLWRHIEMSHWFSTPENATCPWRCSIIPFGSEQEWKMHLEICPAQPQNDSYECLLCIRDERTFPNLLLLFAHHVEIHPEKTYPCAHCPRIFTKKCALKLHLQSHPESRPYQCLKCGFCFKGESSWRFHIKAICGDDPEVKAKLLQKRREHDLYYRGKRNSSHGGESSTASTRKPPKNSRVGVTFVNYGNNQTMTQTQNDESYEEESDEEIEIGYVY